MTRVTKKKSGKDVVGRARKRAVVRARKRTSTFSNYKKGPALLETLVQIHEDAEGLALAPTALKLRSRGGAVSRAYKHGSLAGSVRLPYPPENFTVEELREAIRNIQVSRAV